MFEPVFAALAERDVRYLVAGGVAVVLHGHVRITQDLDLLVDLDPEQAYAAVEALLEIGLRPRLPVDALDFANADIRAQWQRDKGMLAFTMLDPDNPLLAVDLLTSSVDDFASLWDRAIRVRVDSLEVPVISIDDLIAMKRAAGRPMDLLDITELEAIKELS